MDKEKLDTNTNEDGKRKPIFSSLPSKSGKSEYNWETLKDEIVYLERQTYIRHRKEIVTHVQQLVDTDSHKLERIMYIIYERAAREIYKYPIAGMLFEDIGSSMDGRAMNENILDNVQILLQKSLDRLQSKLSNIEKLRGIDVGIVFLLCSLGRLDRIRGGDFRIFRELLARVFKEFYFYVLAASYQDSYWNECFISSLCTLIILLNSEKDLVDSKSVLLIVGILRKLYVLGKLNSSSSLHVLAVLESTKKPIARVYVTSNSFFNSEYLKHCNTEAFVLTGVADYLIEPPAEDKKDLDNGSLSEWHVPEAEDKVVSYEEGRNSPYYKENENTERDISQSDEQLVENGEIISIPEVCIGRVIGMEGAIIRKLEIESGAQIQVLRDEISKPVTTCLNAHRVVARVLGMKAPLPESKIEEEREKFSYVKEMRNKTPMKDIRISGEPEEISKAKKLIDEIVNHTTTKVYPLFDFDYEYITDTIGDKIRTYESLLNVSIKLEEQEDGPVLLHVTGDGKSCQDAKKVVYEELGSITSDLGHLVPLPKSFHEFIKTEADVEKLTCILEEMSEAYITWLKGMEGFFIFIKGYPSQTSKALSLVTRLNIQLLCKLHGLSVEADDNAPIDIEHMRGEQDYWKSLEEVLTQSSYNRSQSVNPSGSDESFVATSPPLRVYDRDFLLECSKSPLAWEFPSTLQNILEGKDSGKKSIILRRPLRRNSNSMSERPPQRRSASLS